MQEPRFPTGSWLSPSVPRKRTRRRRTVFSAQQLRVLEDFFEGKPYGTYEERETLAARLNLQEFQVQVWLKNRRAKHRRLQRLRGQQGQGAHAEPQEPAVCAAQPGPAPAGPASQEEPVPTASPVLPAILVRPEEPVFPPGPVLLGSPVLPANPAFPATPVVPTCPVFPAGPVLPTGPVFPSGPVLPTGPVFPAGPVLPTGPFLPTGPVFPAGPVFPTGPVFPAGPVLPTGPVFPAGSVLPTGPVFPAGPVLPLGPVLPARSVLFEAPLHHGGPGFCSLPPHRPLQVFPAADPSASSYSQASWDPAQGIQGTVPAPSPAPAPAPVQDPDPDPTPAPSETKVSLHGPDDDSGNFSPDPGFTDLLSPYCSWEEPFSSPRSWYDFVGDSDVDLFQLLDLRGSVSPPSPAGAAGPEGTRVCAHVGSRSAGQCVSAASCSSAESVHL